MSSKVAQAYPSNQAELQGQQDFLQEWIEGPREFIKESIYLVNRCTKPDRREFLKVAQAVGIGFCIMGLLGFTIKLIHIPINNLIVGGN